MKRIFIFLITVTLVATNLTLKAQSLEDSLRYAESLWAMKKKAIVLENMQLTEAEKSSFWPVYESYSRATQFLEMEYIHLFSKYSKQVGKLPDHKLEDISTRLLRNDCQMAKVRKQYYKKFKKALSPTLASRFMELDNTFRTLLRIEMQKETPSLDALQVVFYSKKN